MRQLQTLENTSISISYESTSADLGLPLRIVGICFIQLGVGLSQETVSFNSAEHFVQ